MPNLPKPRLRRTARTRGGVATRPSEPERPNVEVVEFASGDGQSLRWINIERPRPADRAWLEEHFDFHPLDYEDVFSRNQRPRSTSTTTTCSSSCTSRPTTRRSGA